MTPTPRTVKGAKVRRVSNFLKAFDGLEEPDLMLDLLVWGSYTAGAMGGQMPVDEGREIFKRIKKSPPPQVT